MTQRRRAPNLTERNAACLLMLKRGDGWLIPEPLRSTGTAAEIVAAVQWDHAHLHALGGCTRPQNITPMLVADHKEKSKKDNGVAAKSKRLVAKEEDFRRKLLAKNTLVWDSKIANWAEPEGEALEELQRIRGENKPKRSAKIRSAGFPTKEQRQRVREKFNSSNRP